MKKLLVAVAMLGLLTGCMGEGEKLEYDIEALNDKKTTLVEEVAQLKSQRDSLKNEVVDLKVENGTARYIVTINIKQKHYNLSLSDHLKDSMNDVSIKVPVDKEFYDSVKVGTVLDNSFRSGSFWLKGSVGRWDITVENKEIR